MPCRPPELARGVAGGAEAVELVSDSDKPLDDITGAIVDAAYKLHTGLGPGLLESVYEVVLARELERRGLRAARQEAVSFEYDGLQFSDCLRVDLLVRLVGREYSSGLGLVPRHAARPFRRFFWLLATGC